jgi:hypothetical protein
MESGDYFTFSNSGMRRWLIGVLVGAFAVAYLFPPSFWLCGVGIALIVCAGLSHSLRTDQWYTWQNWEPQLSWFEGWLGTTGVVLIAVPLLFVALQAVVLDRLP